MTVYVFGEPGMLIVKVGVSSHRSVDERANALRRFWGEGELIYYSGWRATGLDERAAHRMLRPRFWLDGEWFTCGAAVAKSVVRHVVRKSARRRRLSIQEDARNTPQRVKQIWAECGGVPTARDRALIEDAWAKWEAAGGKPRPKLRRRKGQAA